MSKVITIFSKKGGEGKTPIAKLIGDELFAFILTNDDDVLPSIHNRGCKRMELKEIADLNFSELPTTIIDMGGYVERGAVEIFKKSDLLILVIDGKSISSLYRGLSSLEEVLQFNKNVIAIVSKTKRKTDFKRVADQIEERNLKVKALFELKETQLFNQSMREGMSVKDFLESSKLARSTYGKKKHNQTSETVLEQIENIVKYIKEY